jgi:hypothetical protein
MIAAAATLAASIRPPGSTNAFPPVFHDVTNQFIFEGIADIVTANAAPQKRWQKLEFN